MSDGAQDEESASRTSGGMVTIALQNHPAAGSGADVAGL